MKLLAYSSMLIFWVTTLFSQNYEFCVLGKLGSAYIQTNGNKDWTELKTGDQLKRVDLISIKDNSYVGLVHSSGKTIELKEPGQYKVAKLADDLMANTSSILPSVFELIFGKKAGFKDIIEYKQSKKSYSKGAIERSLEIEPIPVLISRKIILINNNITLKWNKLPVVSKYEVKITDRFNKPVFSKVIDDTSITINQKELNLEKDQYYFWRVNLQINPDVRSDEGYFLFLSDKRISEINKNVAQMKNEMNNKETSVSKILLAFYYENNLLVNEADKEFRDAIKLSPNVNDYKELYEAFKDRINSKR